MVHEYSNTGSQRLNIMKQRPSHDYRVVFPPPMYAWKLVLWFVGTNYTGASTYRP